jgi:hypothetical protein
MKKSINKPMKTSMKRSGGWLLAASCASILTIAPQARAEFVPGAVNDHVPLGTAYNRFSGKFLNFQTIKGEVQEDGNTDSNIVSENDLNFRQLSSRLSGDLTIELDFPAIQADAGASVALESASDNYTSNYIYSVINKSKSQVLRGINAAPSPVLSAAGQIIADQYDDGDLNNTKLLQRVGTDYVSEIEYGSQLFVSMKMAFLNATDKLNISGYVSIDDASGTVSFDGSLGVMSSEIKKSVKITVSAHQFGGDPLGLLTILPNNILSCDLDTPTACLELFENAVNYGKGEGAWVGNGFKDQVINLADANVIGYQTSAYDDGSAQMQALVPSSYSFNNNSVIIEQLEREYVDELKSRSRAQATLKHYGSYLTGAQRTELTSINQATTNNAFALASLSDYCRDNYAGGDCDNHIAANCPVSGPSRTCLETYSTSVFAVPSIVVPPPFVLDLRWVTSNPGRDNLISQGLQCTQINEPSDPNTWDDNYLCANIDLGMLWKYDGQIANMSCTPIIEPSDPHAWLDNNLCLPTNSSYEFAWAYHTPMRDGHINNGYSCISMNEGADPHAWADNYLCHREKP